MSLYSQSLSGLVLLVDNRINSYTGIKKGLYSLRCHVTNFEKFFTLTGLNRMLDPITKLTIRLRAGDLALINYHRMEIESEKTNCFSRIVP